MPHNQHRMIRRAERFFFNFRQRIEGVGDQRDREAAALLNLDRVVDTPRRARSSITQAGEDDIRLSRQLVKILFRRALLRRQLAPRDHIRHAVLFYQ